MAGKEKELVKDLQFFRQPHDHLNEWMQIVVLTRKRELARIFLHSWMEV